MSDLYKAGESEFDVDIPYENKRLIRECSSRESDFTLLERKGSGQNIRYVEHHFCYDDYKVVEKDALTVKVNLHVDKEPFDDAADVCERQVDALTGTITYSKGEQVEEIKASGTKVTEAIVGGFFGLVRSEISQQMTELKKKVESLSAKLWELSGMLDEQKKVMERDYADISGRYIKIFNGLDEDCSRRIRSLDKHAFEAKETCDKLTGQRMDMFSGLGSMLDASEEPRLQAQITASAMRRRIQESVGSISFVLNQELVYENYMDQVMHKNVMGHAYDFAPVMTVNSVNLNKQENNVRAYAADGIPLAQRQYMTSMVMDHVDLDSQTVTEEEQIRLNECFNAEAEKWMSQNEGAKDAKNKRVLEMLNRMWHENPLV